MDPNTPTPGDQTPAPRQSARNVPQGDQQLADVFLLAVTEWILRTSLTLEWKTSAEALDLAQRLLASLRTRSEAGDVISPQAARLAELDNMIDGSKETGKLKYVLKGLALQYDDENDGKPYYGTFGIQKVGTNYTLPHDRGERAEALLKLVKAISDPKHNLTSLKYGPAYWKGISDEYSELQPKQDQALGNRATEVSDKNLLREEAEDILVALLYLLRANYPKTYKAERRKFGVLKESYS